MNRNVIKIKSIIETDDIIEGVNFLFKLNNNILRFDNICIIGNTRLVLSKRNVIVCMRLKERRRTTALKN